MRIPGILLPCSAGRFNRTRALKQCWRLRSARQNASYTLKNDMSRVSVPLEGYRQLLEGMANSSALLLHANDSEPSR
jgi:hypothetical protein